MHSSSSFAVISHSLRYSPWKILPGPSTAARGRFRTNSMLRSSIWSIYSRIKLSLAIAEGFALEISFIRSVIGSVARILLDRRRRVHPVGVHRRSLYSASAKRLYRESENPNSPENFALRNLYYGNNFRCSSARKKLPPMVVALPFFPTNSKALEIGMRARCVDIYV